MTKVQQKRELNKTEIYLTSLTFEHFLKVTDRPLRLISIFEKSTFFQVRCALARQRDQP